MGLKGQNTQNLTENQQIRKLEKREGLFYFSISKKQFKFNFAKLLILLTDCRTPAPSFRPPDAIFPAAASEPATRNLPRNNERVSDEQSFPATTSEGATSDLPRSSHPATQPASGISRNLISRLSCSYASCNNNAGMSNQII